MKPVGTGSGVPVGAGEVDGPGVLDDPIVSRAAARRIRIDRRCDAVMRP